MFLKMILIRQHSKKTNVYLTQSIFFCVCVCLISSIVDTATLQANVQQS